MIHELSTIEDEHLKVREAAARLNPEMDIQYKLEREIEDLKARYNVTVVSCEHHPTKVCKPRVTADGLVCEAQYPTAHDYHFKLFMEEQAAAGQYGYPDSDVGPDEFKPFYFKKLPSNVTQEEYDLFMRQHPADTGLPIHARFE